jgi:hypothetical protein
VNTAALNDQNTRVNTAALNVCPFLWPLHCLSFDLRLLITPLISPNISFEKPPEKIIMKEE